MSQASQREMPVPRVMIVPVVMARILVVDILDSGIQVADAGDGIKFQ